MANEKQERLLLIASEVVCPAECGRCGCQGCAIYPEPKGRGTFDCPRCNPPTQARRELRVRYAQPLRPLKLRRADPARVRARNAVYVSAERSDG